MKKVPCSGPACKERRIHWERPDMLRGTVLVEVPDDFKGDAWCSITCAVMSGAMSLTPKRGYCDRCGFKLTREHCLNCNI